MAEDRIEREIVIAAPVEQVWAVLTEPEHVGAWFGTGEPADIDLRPGGMMFWSHNDGAHGAVAARIEKVERPRSLSYRWLHGQPGEEPGRGNSTLIEFTLIPDGQATRLRVVESGFAGLALAEETRRARHEQNANGWTRVLAELTRYSEQFVA
jgi:uncharacterized protein YndB with AHSA1/START domain